MSKFNAKKQGAERVASYEGAELYAKNFEEEWVNFLFSCMMQDGFYESSEIQQERYMALTDQMVAKYGPEFAAKAAVYSRNELGMRSISELTAAIVNGHKFDTKRAFFRKFFRRPDDVAEVFGAIDAIGGKPGVYTARYAPNRDFDIGMDKLLKELNDTNPQNRAAHFSCVIVIAYPDGAYKAFEGRIDGNIATQKTGEAGFGYDPIFIPTGYTRSFAEFSSEEKNKISHRGRALQKFIDFITAQNED